MLAVLQGILDLILGSFLLQEPFLCSGVLWQEGEGGRAVSLSEDT